MLVVLVVYRLGYHAVYLGEVPFAIGAISDGAVYEAAARDIVDRFPLGTRPFYLQGIYAYLLALGLLIKPWISIGLLLQLLLAGLSWWLFHRAMKEVWGARVGALATIALLSYPALAFYENKYLTASLGVSADILVVAALVHASQKGARAVVWVGVAAGLAFLARSNMLMMLPFGAWASVIVTGATGSARGRVLARFALGVGLAVAPMAVRNQIVTGHADVMPVHTGGTSFYIGNNPSARGLWNDADGLLSARVEHEPAELAAELGVDAGSEREQVHAIGRVLYRRAFAWMRAHPGDWLGLELRKLWLMSGNDELTQDYDWYGERELLPYAHRVGLPLGLLLGLAALGLGGRREVPAPSGPRGPQGHAQLRRGLGWLNGGLVVGVLTANLAFFTSSQHRVPLCVPLAVYAGPGLWLVYRAGAARLGRLRRDASDPGPPSSRMHPAWLVLSVLLAAQAFWPRSARTSPHPVHYYNLAVALDQNGDPLAALPEVEHAVQLDPDQPFFRLKRAMLRRRLGDIDGARADVDWLWAREDLPHGVRADVRFEWWAIEELRRAAGRAPRDLPPPP